MMIEVEVIFVSGGALLLLVYIYEENGNNLSLTPRGNALLLLDISGLPQMKHDSESMNIYSVAESYNRE